MQENELVVVLAVLMAVFTFATLFIVGSRYRKVGPDEALVISGGRTGFRVIRGGGTFVWLVLETSKVLNLRIVTLYSRVSTFHAALGAPTIIEAMAQVKIDATSHAALATAAEHFMITPSAGEVPADRDTSLARLAQPMLDGHVRSLIGTAEAEKVFAEIGPYSEKLKAALATDLAKVGLSLITLTLGVGKESAVVPIGI